MVGAVGWSSGSSNQIAKKGVRARWRLYVASWAGPALCGSRRTQSEQARPIINESIYTTTQQPPPPPPPLLGFLTAVPFAAGGSGAARFLNSMCSYKTKPRLVSPSSFAALVNKRGTLRTTTSSKFFSPYFRFRISPYVPARCPDCIVKCSDRFSRFSSATRRVSPYGSAENPSYFGVPPCVRVCVLLCTPERGAESGSAVLNGRLVCRRARSALWSTDCGTWSERRAPDANIGNESSFTHLCAWNELKAAIMGDYGTYARRCTKCLQRSQSRSANERGLRGGQIAKGAEEHCGLGWCARWANGTGWRRRERIECQDCVVVESTESRSAKRYTYHVLQEFVRGERSVVVQPSFFVGDVQSFSAHQERGDIDGVCDESDCFFC